jgi:general stress protein 26
MSKEGNGADILFHTNTETGKTDDLAANPEINLGFLNSFGEWASISGNAEVITDRSKVKEYYSPGLKAWLGDLGDGTHDGGPEDPRIGLIKVKSQTAQYAVSRKNILTSAVEIAKGVVTGEVPQTNKMRFLSESELDKVRSGST